MEIDVEGLRSALAELAGRTQRRHGVACTLVCEQAVLVPDNGMATQLFRIAQEAVTNAIKHTTAAQIVVSLEAADGRLRLSIHDDGEGLPSDLDQTGSLGLRIMGQLRRADRRHAGDPIRTG